jgi:hypothetical protein
MWGAAFTDHPAGRDPWFSWLALGEGVDRMASTLTEVMDQRERILVVDDAARWIPGPRTPAVLWWPTASVLSRHRALRDRIVADGARLGVYLHPSCPAATNSDTLELVPVSE